MPPERLERLGRDLRSPDPRKAYRAIATLARSPGQAVEWLKKSRPAGAGEDYARWIDELDADRFEVREAATRRLAYAAELAEVALLGALARPLTAEARNRVNRLLEKLTTAAPRPSTLATVRTMELLEIVNTPAARAAAEAMERRPGDPLRNREAKQTLERMRR
jgi:hypothetical protein